MKWCSSSRQAALRTLWWWRLMNTAPRVPSTMAAADSGRGLCQRGWLCPPSCG
jgi:hypothetical protein